MANLMTLAVSNLTAHGSLISRVVWKIHLPVSCLILLSQPCQKANLNAFHAFSLEKFFMVTKPDS